MKVVVGEKVTVFKGGGGGGQIKQSRDLQTITHHRGDFHV